MKNISYIVFSALLFSLCICLNSTYAANVDDRYGILLKRTELNSPKKSIIDDFFQENRQPVIAELSNTSNKNDLHITICSYEFSPSQKLIKSTVTNQTLQPGQTTTKEWTIRKNNRVYIEIRSLDTNRHSAEIGQQGYVWIYTKNNM